jgi:hypothetical protein
MKVLSLHYNSLSHSHNLDTMPERHAVLVSRGEASSMQVIEKKTVFLILFATLLPGVGTESGTAAPVPVAAAPAAVAPHEPVSVRLPSPAFAAMQTIDPEHIRWHVRFLSHDLLEGRGTGQRGGDIAAEYMATQFAEYGLKPAGDNGTYLQKVPLVGVTTLPETQFSFIPKEGQAITLKPLDDYVAYDQSQQQDSMVNADIVYVGYGIEASEYKWDDYKGVDVHGKVLLMLVNEPPSDDPAFFKGKALTYYGRWTYKYEVAARKGAVGVILIHKQDMASYPWEVVRIISKTRRAGAEGRFLGAIRCGQETGVRLRNGSGQDDGRCADARISSGGSGSETKSPYGEQDPGFRVQQCARNPARLRPQSERPSRHLHGALRSSRHSSGTAGRQHL